MNTILDLDGEFARLASQAPEYDAIRGAVTAGIAKREKRRRTTALVAVAAAVVLVAGGIGVTSAMLRSGPSTARPASIPPVVDVPEVPLPADTQLIRHQLQPVVSPVTAAPPDGLTGTTWMQSPGRLAVSYFEPQSAAGAAGGWTTYAPLADAAAPRTAGYAITDGEDDPLRTVGQNGLAAAEMTQRDITVGGHAAILATAPPNTSDVSGFPATERLSWQLPDGRYIHVWATGSPTRDSSPSTALAAFAQSITDEPATLVRTVGVGLTLPGLTVDLSVNMSPVTGYVGGSVIMCPPGVDPLASTSSSIGSGSWAGEGSTGSGSGAAESTSIAPGAGEGSVISSNNPAAPCLSAAVASAAAIGALQSGGAEVTSVGGVAVHVDAANNQASADLGNGLVALVKAPDGTKPAAADLAALAASVRLSPDVEVIPFKVPGGQGSGGTASAWGSSSVVASSSATAIPSGSVAPNPDEHSGNPIDFDRVDAVTATLGPDRTTAAVEFTLRNMAEKSVILKSLSLEVPGMTHTALKVRLDNTPSDADAAFQDAVLPTMLAQGTRLRIQLTFNLHQAQCSAAAEGVPTLRAEWQAESSGGGFSEAMPITDPAGGLRALLKPVCG